MNDRLFDMMRIIVVDQPDTVHIALWWSDLIFETMTQGEHKRLGRLVHDLCLELRPILARMEEKSISKNMPPRKQMPN